MIRAVRTGPSVVAPVAAGIGATGSAQFRPLVAGRILHRVDPLGGGIAHEGMKPIPPMIPCVIVLALLTLLMATDPETGASSPPARRPTMPTAKAGAIGPLNGRLTIYQLTGHSLSR